MKKILLIVSILIVAGAGYIIVNKEQAKNQEISKEEQEFNESGQAKAILDEVDLWKFYESKEGGFSIKYPHDVSFDGDTENLLDLTIEIDEVEGLEGTMGFNEETALKNVKSLEKAEYGETVDIPLKESKKVRDIDGISSQEFMVLSRFEVCDVTFQRKVYFFNDNKQIVITLSGPKEMIIDSMSEYFETNSDNCGDEKIWNFEKQKDFYKKLSENRGVGIAQDWFNSFDRVIDTIRFNNDLLNTLELIQGTWTSLDDDKSVIEFNKNEIVDYYDNSKMSEGTFKIYNDSNFISINNNGSGLVSLINGERYEYSILSLSENSLILSYLPRGNTLKYSK
jgi:hypothetical protein